MLVLDALRSVQRGRILFPPFHNGHLGFLPGTVVSITAFVVPHQRDRVEVILTPFRQEIQKMARLICVLQDRPGAVRALARAVAALGVNVGIQESGSINAFQQHLVSMILGWSASEEYGQDVGEPADSTTVARYQTLRRLFPVDEKRYVKLFESIVVHCADYLEWQHIAGLWLPQLSIQPIHDTRPRADLGSAVIARSRRKWVVQLQMPESLENHLAGHLEGAESSKQPLRYLISSDLYQRAARVVFLSERLQRRLVPMGFHMKDRPGALAATLEVIAEAQLNIVTSIHRRLKARESRSVWDVLLECPVEHGALEPKRSFDFVLRRLRRAVIALRRRSPEAVTALRNCDVAVGVPQFPARRRAKKPVAIIGRRMRRDSRIASPLRSEQYRDSENLKEVRRLLKSARGRAGRAGLTRAEGVLRTIENELAPSCTTIFLSYPRTAAKLARALKPHLQREGYRLDDYQVGDGEVILKEVGKKIRECDYFVGLWHRDTGRGRGSGVSPWMPYELGLAVAGGKPTFVVYDEKLPEWIRDRISKDRANMTYSERRFRQETVRAIVDYCKKNFPIESGTPTMRRVRNRA